MPRFAVRIEGLPSLLRKLQTGKPIYAEPWTRVIRRNTALAYNMTRDRAPVLSGRTKGGIRSQMDARPVPLWGRVIETFEGSDFRYPFALDAGKRRPAGEGRATTRMSEAYYKVHKATIVYHYRGTRKRTGRWFRGVWGKIKKQLAIDLKAAAKQVEANWRRW